MMKIYEVLFNNCCECEENRTRSFFYETEAEARDVYEHPEKTGMDFFQFCDFFEDVCTAEVNSIELGTQIKEVVCEERNILDETIKRVIEEQSRAFYAQQEAINKMRRVEAMKKKAKEERKKNQQTPKIELGDVEALAELRDRLAGIA